jgi:putative oxidoreductase
MEELKMTTLFIIGRIILGAFFINSAFNHFSHIEMMSGYSSSKKIPMPKLAVIVSGVLLLYGGLSIITGFVPISGIIAMIIFLVPVSIMMHNFWAVQEAQSKMAEMVNFTKNMALLGATLMMTAIPTPWAFSLNW